MRILLTNDDGINAEGLKNLYDTISKYGFVKDIWVVAPGVNKSCCSHSMSFNKEITATKQGDKQFMVTGTPVDCVIIAIQDLMKEYKPDMVISGINAGANIDVDVTYSGTVAAAREASLLGIPAIAISQIHSGYKKDSTVGINWQHNDKIFSKLLGNLITLYQDRNIFRNRSLININLPIIDIVGVEFLAQGAHYLGNRIESINKEKDKTKYVIGTNYLASADHIQVVSSPLSQGYITVTPVGVDLTHYELLDYIINNKAIH